MEIVGEVETNLGGGGGGGCSGLPHDPLGKLGLRTVQNQRRDVCM